MDMYRRLTNGFTLVEILTVIVIVALLSAILFPAFASVKRRAYEVPCTSNLRQLYLAMDLYATDHDARYATAPRSLVSLDSYVPTKEIFRCPVENRIPKGSDGMYPGRVGYLWLVEDDVRSPWRISYAYVADYESTYTDEHWEKLQSRGDIGLLACPWHGVVAEESLDSTKRLTMPKIEGPILRLCFDGHFKRIPKREDEGWNLFYYWFH